MKISSTSLLGEKSGGLLQDLAFLSKELILLAQAGELLANILMRAFKQIALLVLGTPPAQRRFGYAEIICNPLDAASAGQRQPHRLPFELVRKSSLLFLLIATSAIFHRGWLSTFAG